MNWVRKIYLRLFARAYDWGFWEGIGSQGDALANLIIERSVKYRIRKNIMERVTDLRACGKSNDNCAEFAHYIESYIDEWLTTDEL
jgi:hypothetical protein